MAVFKILGNVYQIGQTETKPTQTGGSFSSRMLILIQRRYDQDTGEELTPNYPQFEFTGNACQKLDSFGADDRVQVSFDIVGVKYNDKQTGEERNLTKLRGFNIVPYTQQQQYVPQQPQAAAPQYQPQPQAQPQPQYPQQGYQQGGYVPQQNYPQQGGYVPQQGQGQQRYDEYGNPLSF